MVTWPSHKELFINNIIYMYSTFKQPIMYLTSVSQVIKLYINLFITHGSSHWVKISLTFFFLYSWETLQSSDKPKMHCSSIVPVR